MDITLRHLSELRSFTARDPLRIDAERKAAEGEQLLSEGLLKSFLRALEPYKVALEKWKEVRERYWEETTLTNIGLVYDKLGEKTKALALYREALPPETLNSIGVVYSSLGENRSCLRLTG